MGGRPPSLHRVELIDLARTWRRAAGVLDHEPGSADVRSVSLTDLDGEDVVVAVGPPGSGKTAEMYRWYLASSDSRWVNLAQLSDARSLADEASKVGAEGVLFIDGCDEFDGNAAALLGEVGHLLEDAVRLRITARETWWHHRQHLAGRLAAAVVITLDPLDEVGAISLLHSAGCDTASLESALDFGSAELIANPRLLVAWARTVERGSPPANRRELYRSLTEIAAEESNEVLATLGPSSRDASAVLSLARRVAAFSTLGRRSTLVTSATAAGDDRINITRIPGVVPESASVADWLTASPLLVPSGDGWLFADRTTAEFLAGAELSRCVDGDRAPERWQQLLSTVIGNERFIPPELRGVAAWASEHDEAAFDVVIALDPSVLLEQPGARYTGPAHARIFELLLSDQYLLRQASAHPGLITACIAAVDNGEERLLDLAASPGEDEESRRRALELIAASGSRAFDSAMASLVCDGSVPDLLRYWATLTASESQNADLLRDVFDTVIADDAPDDPGWRILGLMLRAMWPEHLHPDELIQVLRPPNSDGILEYEYFLWSLMARHARPEDVPPLLDWLLEADGKWRPRRSVKSVVERAGGILLEPGDPDVRHQVVVSIAAGAQGLADNSPASGFPDLIAACGAADLLQIVESCLPSIVHDRPWIAGSVLSHIAAHPDPAVATALRLSMIDKIEGSGSNELAEAWIRAVSTIWRSTDRDAEITARVNAMEGAHKAQVQAIVDFIPPPLPDPPAPAPEPEDAAVTQLRAIAAGDAPWRSVVTANVSHGRGHLGLWHQRLSDTLGPDVVGVRASARSAASQRVGDSSWDRDGIDGNVLAWGYAVEAIAWLEGADSAAPFLARQPDAAVRCRAFIVSEPFVDALARAAASQPDSFVAAVRVQVEHVARCPRCRGRLDFLRNLPDVVLVEVDDLLLGLAVDRTIPPDARVNVVGGLRARGQFTGDQAGGVLDSFSGTEQFGQAFLDLSAGAWWHESASDLPEDDRRTLIRAIATAASYLNEEEGALSGLSNDALADLYQDATRLFERGTFQSGFVPIENTVDDLRNRCIGELVGRGTDAVDVLLRLAETTPLTNLIGVDRLRQLLEASWTPLPPDKVSTLLDEPDRAVLVSAEAVVALLQRGLAAYEDSLRATGGGVEQLREQGRPRNELSLSVDLQRFLRTWFGARPILADREVELRPIATWKAPDGSRAWAGERADIVVHAVDPDRTWSIVLELKGSWNPDWKSAAQTQLVDRYLDHPDVHGGILVVFWFDRPSWPENDYRRRQSPADIHQVRTTLDDWELTGVVKPVVTLVVNAGIPTPT